MDKANFGLSCMRMEKLLKLRESLNPIIKCTSQSEPHRKDYLALSEQLNKTIAEEARCLDAASR